MTWTRVTSSNLKWVSYNSRSQEMLIQFQSGAVYQYWDVPGNISQGLVQADSPGKFFNQNVRNRYNYKRVK